MKPEWRQFEEWLAKTFQGKRSAFSGGSWSESEDARGCWPAWLGPSNGTEVLVQAKCSGKAVRISAKDVDGLVVRAVREGRKPVVAFKVGPYVICGEVIRYVRYEG